MYSVIRDKTPQDQDYPARYYDLMIYKRVLDGSLYDCFEHPYHVEYTGTEQFPRYVRESERAPCINTGLSLMRSVVDQSVGFLWGEDRFPQFVTDDDTKQIIKNLVRDTSLVRVMSDATTRGSIGSVAVHVAVLKDRFFLNVMDTIFLTPEYDPEAPDTLVRITHRQKFTGQQLMDAGYKLDAPEKYREYWFHRLWDRNAEIWYQPYPVGAEKESNFSLRVDASRSPAPHNLGLVPFHWIKNLPGADGDSVDGRCTFAAAIPNCVQIDYALSRADRALKYNSDPLMVVKTRKRDEMVDFVRSDGNALVLGVEGDATLLEISGNAADAILKTVDELKDEAMAAIHGTRADPDRLATSQSSVAQRMLYLPMVQLASHLRITYGDEGLVPLLKMMIKIAADRGIKVLGKTVRPKNANPDIELAWNDFFPATPFDQLQVAQALTPLIQEGVISKRTALENLRKYYDFGNIDDEIAQIGKERDEDNQREIDLQTAIKPPITQTPKSRSK